MTKKHARHQSKGKKTYVVRAEHLCHAKDCKVAVPPSMFMCKRHWYMVPKKLRDAVWAAYRPGQEITKTPSREYLKVTKKAIEAVAAKEVA